LLTGAAGDALRDGVFSTVLDLFDDAAEPLRSALAQRVFELLLDHIAESRGRGDTLLAFLDREVERGATVAVTGHSKGGALAIAAALWLAKSWAPTKNATVECFSFAGPTAGDAEFVQLYDAALGSRTRCIVNSRDIVPMAWVVAGLGDIGVLYPFFKMPVDFVSLCVEDLGYTHVGGQRIAFARPEGTPRSLVQEIVYQHMDAYLEEAGFSPKWTVDNLFLDPRPPTA
jgi:hypothetical protein